MTTVTENVDLPATMDPTAVVVTLEVVGEGGEPLREVYWQSGSRTVAGFAQFALTASGTWSESVVGNADLLPAGTAYRRTLTGREIPVTYEYATVPTTGGPYRWDQILTDAPASITSAALTLGLATKVNKVGDTMTGSLILSGTSNLSVSGDATINGELLTGTFGSPATFGGIEREGRVFPAGEMMSPTGVVNFGDGFPRINLPNGVTTDVYMIIEVEEWWLDSTIGVYFEWVNDHSTTGDVRFDCEIKECDIATETLVGADVIATRTFTTAAPAANTPTTSIVASVLNGNPCSFDPGPFASFYVLRISRIGANAADTLAGPVGLLAASMTRGQ